MEFIAIGIAFKFINGKNFGKSAWNGKGNEAEPSKEGGRRNGQGMSNVLKGTSFF